MNLLMKIFYTTPERFFIESKKISQKLATFGMEKCFTRTQKFQQNGKSESFCSVLESLVLKKCGLVIPYYAPLFLLSGHISYSASIKGLGLTSVD